MAFFIDDEEIGRVTYPEGGMWEHGEVSLGVLRIIINQIFAKRVIIKNLIIRFA